MHKLFLATALGLFATTAQAIDTCAVGVWEANGPDIAHIMATQMDGNAQFVGGRVTMEITEFEVLTILVNDLKINVVVPDVPAMDVKVTGYSAGSMNIDGGNWTANVVDYELVGSADVLGQTMSIPFSSATGMFGSGAGVYGCSGDGLSFDSNGGGAPKIPRQWRRVG